MGTCTGACPWAPVFPPGTRSGKKETGGHGEPPVQGLPRRFVLLRSGDPGSGWEPVRGPVPGPPSSPRGSGRGKWETADQGEPPVELISLLGDADVHAVDSHSQYRGSRGWNCRNGNSHHACSSGNVRWNSKTLIELYDSGFLSVHFTPAGLQKSDLPCNIGIIM